MSPGELRGSSVGVSGRLREVGNAHSVHGVVCQQVVRQPGRLAEDKLVRRVPSSGEVPVLRRAGLCRQEVQLLQGGRRLQLHGLLEQVLKPTAVAFAASVLPRRLGVRDVLQGSLLL
eukprot:213790-Alexandrium_andersonii.AAC.1